MENRYFDTEEFKRCAREKYIPGTEINPLWHEVIKAECQKINEEYQKLKERMQYLNNLN